jgi:hypothetical protein
MSLSYARLLSHGLDVPSQMSALPTGSYPLLDVLHPPAFVISPVSSPPRPLAGMMPSQQQKFVSMPTVRAPSIPLSHSAMPPPSPPSRGSKSEDDEEVIEEDSNAIRLSIDLPGVLADDVRVSFRSGVLDVHALRRTMSMDGRNCIKKRRISRHVTGCSRPRPRRSGDYSAQGGEIKFGRYNGEGPNSCLETWFSSSFLNFSIS